MRRRWKALVVVGGVLLLAGLLFLLPPRDDGLDWVRKFGGSEDPLIKSAWKDNTGVLRTEYVSKTFKFGRFPEEFIRELHEREIPHADQTWLVSEGSTSDGYAYSLSYETGTVTFKRGRALNWIELRWLAIRRSLGLGTT